MFRILNRRLIFGTAIRLTPTFIIPIIGQRNVNDTDNTSRSEDIKSTGWDRVKAMYTKR